MRPMRPSPLSWIVFSVLAAVPWAATAVLVSGTRVSLVPPEGFVPAERFPGFQRVDIQASIMVTEMPAPVAEMKKGMTKENLATRGIELLASETQPVDGREGLLLHTSQRVGDVEFRKWMLVAGDPGSTVMIMGTFPTSAAAEVGEAIRASVLTASWTASGQGDPFEGLAFRVTASPSLKLAGRVSNLVMLTESGSTGPLGPGEPLYIAGSSISDVPIADLAVFAEARLKQTEQIEEIKNLRGRALELGGLAAYELVAEAKDVKSATELLVYQVIARDGKGYFIVQGLVGAGRGEELLAEFRRVTSTLARTAE